MKWRPEGWEEFKISRCVHRQGLLAAKIEPAGCDTCPTNIKECHIDLEAGADGMLEGLFKMASESPTKTFMIDSREHHVYFISEGTK